MDTGHEVTVMTRDGSTQRYPDAAFSVDDSGTLTGLARGWHARGRADAPGQWACVKATGAGLGPVVTLTWPVVVACAACLPAGASCFALGRPARPGGAGGPDRARHAIRRRGIAWRYGSGAR